jgi:hypothetical protein
MPTMKRLVRAPGLLAGVLGLALLGGCGRGSGPVRHEVTGTVLYDGKPLDDGVIFFEPADGQGSQDGATITNGEYRIPRDKGLFPGRYRVRILGGDGSSGGGQATPEARNAGAARGRERIPPEYNEKSDLVREVKDGEANRFDFSIPRR